MTDKETARSVWRHAPALHRGAPPWGKAAEKLRSLQVYRDAAAVFATPGQSLHQARVNCLVDGKSLVMPSPSMRDGFFLVPAHSLPFKDLSAAVTYKGLKKSGLLLKSVAVRELSLGLLLTDSLAVDSAGARLGDGHGFFDLCCALLQELGGLQQDATFLTFILEEQLSPAPLPRDAWDIQMNGAITPARILHFKAAPQKPRIFWDVLPLHRIKRIDPLWKLYKAQGPGQEVQG